MGVVGSSNSLWILCRHWSNRDVFLGRQTKEEGGVMDIVVAIALYESRRRAKSVVHSLLDCVGIENITTLFVNTGSVSSELERIVSMLPKSLYYQVEPKRRQYADVMMAKISALKDWGCPDDAILCSWDDDYIMNPWVFPWIHKIFNENSHVQYLSPMWTGAMSEPNSEVLSEFKLYKTGSCMGGSITTRAQPFIDDALGYLMQRDRDMMFDRGFWRMVKAKYGWKEFMYTPGGFSLVQHLNFTSHFLDQKGSPEEHMEGIRFVMGNPFETLKAKGHR